MQVNGKLPLVRPVCPKCESKSVRVNQDGTVVCLRCGARTPKR